MRIVINNKFQIAEVIKESDKTYTVIPINDVNPILNFYSRFMRKDSIIYCGKLSKKIGILLDEFIGLNTTHVELIKKLRITYSIEVIKLSEKLKKLG